MSKKDAKRSGRDELKSAMKKMMAEKFGKSSKGKALGEKKMLKATIMAEDEEGLAKGAKTLSEMMLSKYKKQKDDDDDDDDDNDGDDD